MGQLKEKQTKWQTKDELSWVYWCFTSHATLFQSYIRRHRCAGGLKKKLYLRSGFQCHKHLAGFFNVPVLHRHRTTLFIRWFRHTAPFYDTLRIRRTFSRLKPPAFSRGKLKMKIKELIKSIWQMKWLKWVDLWSDVDELRTNIANLSSD